MDNRENDVVLAFLKLSRAMRRCPPERREYPFPPAVGRLLECAAANSNVSSRELCEALDVRPSSLSEMLARAEAEGLLTRTADETDRRVQRVSLTARGRQIVSEMENARCRDSEKKAACLTPEERKTFCELCGRLSEHIESLALDLPEGMKPFRHGPGGPEGPEGPGGPHGPCGPRPEEDCEPGEPGPHPHLPTGVRYRC